MYGVSGLEEGAKSIFKDVVVQRCIVHLIRNSIKYIPSKDYKAYTAQLKKVYDLPSLRAAEAEFKRFRQVWSQYPGAIDVRVRNWTHVEQLFNYGSAVRKVMFNTNAIEAVNSSFRKVTKNGAFPMRTPSYKYSIFVLRCFTKNGQIARHLTGPWSATSSPWMPVYRHVS